MFTEPAIGSNFINRDYFLNTLIKRISALEDGFRHNIAILGPEAIGKTSLILQGISKLQESAKLVLPIYLEVTNRIPFDHLVKKFIATIIFNFLKRKSEDVPQDLDELIKKSQEFIPRTIEEILKCRSLLDRKKKQEAYFAMLDLPKILSEEINAPVVLILEEFHNFNRLPLKEPFKVLAKKIMIQKTVMYIISSSQVELSRKILTCDLTLLFGNFELLELDNFDTKTSEELIEKKFDNVKCSLDYKQFIVEIAGGQPLYLNTISAEIGNIAARNGLKFVTDKIIIEALMNLVFSLEGILNNFFANRINQLPLNRSPISYSSILFALGRRNLKSRQIKDYLKINSEKEFSNHLIRLLELEYIRKSGLFYYIHDKLFKIWLTDVYEGRNSSPEADYEARRERFKKAMHAELVYFLKEKRKDITERLKDLFAGFNNEAFSINSKKIVFPSFGNIEMKNIRNATPIMICRTKYRPWLFVVKEDCVHEADMEDIISNCNKLKGAYQRKIVIALKGMQEDARLIAKEERFLIIDSVELNRLFALFGKNKFFT